MSYAVDYFADMGQISQDCSSAATSTDFDMDDLDDLDQVTQVIGYHPHFHDHFLRTQNFIMKGDGPLPNDYRYYLAIIAAARHQCPYLVKRYEKEFINQGGSSEWLRGLDHIPDKLRAIYDINKILAHRPWLLRKEHIELLTKGINSWSLSEVVHAMVLLSHFHSLSSFVFSCGLTQKLDGLSSPKLKSAPATLGAPATATAAAAPSLPPQPQPQPLLSVANAATIVRQTTTTPVHQKTVLGEISLNTGGAGGTKPDYNTQNAASNNGSGGAPGDGAGGAAGGGGAGAAALNGYLATAQQLPQQHGISVEALMERMKVLSQNQDECSEAELSSRFKNVEMQTAELAAVTPGPAVALPPNISHYVDDANFIYQDFARRGAENVNTFRIQDYSWEDHGYSLVDGLYNDVGTYLDEKFRSAYNLTYCTMGGIKNVDTSKFRRAIWNYIQCIYGIRHDDYDYGEVNQLLVRPLKMFIKTACCFPERITTKDYDSVLVELQDSEKVHVNLMIMEARNQAELLYALREIMRYMT
ncbi:sestrin homolog isoform X1 [Drosophila pseudoobscura]|uniref:Sestrin homolog isoform X1 n=1 Tax=Drosophila pseudoobscura pseudoobscura TaxID=46245 RepID=A0A6I8VVL3_DROPS|nr:sestrin homolog isoform X1 [Drosophila pseudoobscura]XP_033235131.1 sestrin homolog isoform X1 [Drosophila pseudoobscura]